MVQVYQAPPTCAVCARGEGEVPLVGVGRGGGVEGLVMMRVLPDRHARALVREHPAAISDFSRGPQKGRCGSCAQPFVGGRRLVGVPFALRASESTAHLCRRWCTGIVDDPECVSGAQYRKEEVKAFADTSLGAE